MNITLYNYGLTSMLSRISMIYFRELNQPGDFMLYSFKTEYLINASTDRIWDILSDVESWPGIWRYFRKSRFTGDDKILREKNTIECEVKSLLPYSFRFNTEIVKVVPRRELEVICSGDLNGRGLWILTPVTDGTLSSFMWEVEPENRFIRFAGSLPFGSRILRYSHNVMMENGYRSLLALLENDKISQPA